jgi:hypothetical protein
VECEERRKETDILHGDFEPWELLDSTKMSWLIPHWSESIKKRLCRYLLQRYLGQFLEEKLTLDQLSIDLYNGKCIVNDVSLDVQVNTH